ncbi:MAG TPA: AtpZ/AtpI family protein [Tepidisphaeraceae bacterium]|jgi:ATP synthase protein I
MAEGSKKPGPDDASVLRQLGAVTSLGFEFIATVLLPGGIGYWLDRRYDTSPWFILIGGVFGFAVGLYRMLKVSAAAMK